jgi:hypothetical protein
MPYSIGKIEKLDLREIWKREDTDFTKWLAEQIEFLNVSLHLPVQNVERRSGD